jgi:hypothetical protein
VLNDPTLTMFVDHGGSSRPRFKTWLATTMQADSSATTGKPNEDQSHQPY